jgi:three-Cys-motif partner protein
MTGRKRGRRDGKEHRFGGDWTDTKLGILREYLEAYSKALKNTPFKTAYIDAFAGTGYRTLEQTEGGGHLLFPDLAEEATQKFLEGSARIALKVKPGFDRYLFVEKDEGRCNQLKSLRDDFPDLAEAIQVNQGEANKVIQDLCKKNWKDHRAVLFLDPYGMNVEWTTLAKVARTRAIDLWILFPLGIGVNRLLPRSGQIPEGWRNRLNLILGTEDWYEAFYKVETTPNLFGELETTVVKQGIDVIGEYFLNRLRTVFPGVANKPKILTNSMNCPLYLLCFAVSSHNTRAQEIALNIANHILKSD